MLNLGEDHIGNANGIDRHVRVNHSDVDLNDSKLRDVLNQRLEPGTRGRRRRQGG